MVEVGRAIIEKCETHNGDKELSLKEILQSGNLIE